MTGLSEESKEPMESMASDETMLLPLMLMRKASLEGSVASCSEKVRLISCPSAEVEEAVT